MHKRLALIPITGLMLLTLGGCATTPSGNGANNSHVKNSAATTPLANVLSHSGGATNNTASSTAGAPANNVQVSVSSTPTSQSSYASEISLIKNKGYLVNGTAPNASVRTSSGAILSAWMGVSGRDGHNQFVFFFLNGDYLGTDTAKPSIEITSVTAAGNGIAVTYPVYKKNDSFANPTGTPVTITYTWNGSKLVPNKPYPNQFQASGTSVANQSPSTAPFGDAQISFNMVPLNLTTAQINMIKNALKHINGNPNTMQFGNGAKVYVPAEVAKGTQLLSASAGSSRIFGTHINLSFSQFDFALSDQLPSDIAKTKYSIPLSDGGTGIWYTNKPGTGGTTYFFIHKVGKTYLIYYSNLKLISSALIDEMGNQWVPLGAQS
ncbi:LppP/LprE family lipoprotein [Alicyclobacillus mengziensis]|uniref:LppP/LprE family lipoprotein n=1 Tax=Alicyclobacillus mengziensis TaxID=2931921 RepID=A0A9X7VZR3_9BACL|nr:LppP/LprE family lipoprotein [Alicyclobacillus mengziensis]QSO47684.1 LppP/LprE family lipoprotein [Alicyclobacillus mengziensis]